VSSDVSFVHAFLKGEPILYAFNHPLGKSLREIVMESCEQFCPLLCGLPPEPMPPKIHPQLREDLGNVAALSAVAVSL
jgi:hypothetical protein